MNRPKVEVCFSPSEYFQYLPSKKIVVVVDVLRATTAICVGIHNGIEKIIPISTLEEAFEYKKKGFIVAAERKGEIVEGFNLGNSPYSYMDSKLKGKTVVMTTTNGTKSINIAKDAEQVVIGALVNFDSISNWLKEQKEDTLILCSGWQNKFNLEDTICAGAIVDYLLNTGDFESEEDSSIAAKYLSRSARENYFGYLKSSSHRRRLRKLNIHKDIKYSLTPNQLDIIPILKDDALIKLI